MPKMKFTAQGIKGIKPPATGRVDYQDQVVRGLVLRVSASGRASFSVSYRRDGKRQRVTLGDASLLSLSEAREGAKKILRRVRLDIIDPAAAKRAQREADTFAELARRYVERWAKVRKAPKSAREDELRIEKMLIPRWGSWKAADVCKRDVVALLDKYVDAGKPYAANRMQGLISKVYNFGIERDEVDVNPAAGIRLQLEKPRQRVLTDDELKKVLPLFAKEELVGLGFRFLLLTGQRPGEVFNMRWSELDGDLWSLPAERSKNGRPNLVPLSAAARAVLLKLKAYDNGSGFVFPSPTRKNLPYKTYFKVIARVRNDAGLDEPWRVYDLKSTCLTGLESLGVPGAVISAVANHAPSGVTSRHYAFHDFADEKRDALERWGRHVSKLDPSTKAEVVELRRGAR